MRIFMQLTSFSRFLTIPFAIAISIAAVESTYADKGEPVAVRRSDGCLVIESMWNLSVQIVTADQFRSMPIEGVDLLRRPATMSSLKFRARQDVPPGTTLDQTLDRPANADSATWTATADLKDPTSNAIRVRGRTGDRDRCR